MENRLLGQFIQRIVRRSQPQNDGFELNRMIERYPMQTQKAFLDAYAWDSMLGYGVKSMMQGKPVAEDTFALLNGTEFIGGANGKQLAKLQIEVVHESWRKNNIGKFYLRSGEIQSDFSQSLMSLASLQAAPIDLMTAHTQYDTNMRAYMMQTSSDFLRINDIVSVPYDPDEIIDVLAKIQNGSHYIGIMFSDLSRLHTTPLHSLTLA